MNKNEIRTAAGKINRICRDIEAIMEKHDVGICEVSSALANIREMLRSMSFCVLDGEFAGYSQEDMAQEIAGGIFCALDSESIHCDVTEDMEKDANMNTDVHALAECMMTLSMMAED